MHPGEQYKKEEKLVDNRKKVNPFASGTCCSLTGLGKAMNVYLRCALDLDTRRF